MVIKESQVERYFKREVERHGATVWKFVSPNQSGVPDRVVLMRDGTAVFAEIKAPGKKPRPLQLAVFEKMERLNFHVWVIDSYEAVSKFVEHYVKIGCLK